MKRLSIAAALFAVSTLAQATSACTAAGVVTAVPNGVAGTDFVLRTFTPRCSSNIALDYAQDDKAIGVGAASAKGATAFEGNSEGGSVKASATVLCTNKRCDGTEAAGAAAAALVAAGS